MTQASKKSLNSGRFPAPHIHIVLGVSLIAGAAVLFFGAYQYRSQSRTYRLALEDLNASKDIANAIRILRKDIPKISTIPTEQGAAISLVNRGARDAKIAESCIQDVRVINVPSNNVTKMGREDIVVLFRSVSIDHLLDFVSLAEEREDGLVCTGMTIRSQDSNSESETWTVDLVLTRFTQAAKRL